MTIVAEKIVPSEITSGSSEQAITNPAVFPYSSFPKKLGAMLGETFTLKDLKSSCLS